MRDTTAEDLTEATELKLEAKIEAMIHNASKTLDEKIQKLDTNISLLNATTLKCSELTLATQTNANTIQDTVTQLPLRQTTNPIFSTPSPYRDAVNRNASPITSATSAKIANCLTVQNRQIMIEFTPDSPNSPKDASNETVTALRKKATEIMAKLKGSTANGADIRGLTITKKGHVLLELASDTGAKWLQQPDNEANFTKAFAPGAKIRKRNYAVILKFVPIEWNISEPETIRELEKDLDLQPNDIVNASWIKSPSHRAPTQKVANAKLICSSPQAANTILISSIRISGRYVTPKKDIPKPSTCSKCQNYGHYVAGCTETKDKCGRCAGEHRTAACTNKGTTKCSPCGSTNHYTNHRECPEFQKRSLAQETRNPETTKPFFPTEDKWTWDDSTDIPWLNSTPAILNIPTDSSQTNTTNIPYSQTRGNKGTNPSRGSGKGPRGGRKVTAPPRNSNQTDIRGWTSYAVTYPPPPLALLHPLPSKPATKSPSPPASPPGLASAEQTPEPQTQEELPATFDSATETSV